MLGKWADTGGGEKALAPSVKRGWAEGGDAGHHLGRGQWECSGDQCGGMRCEGEGIMCDVSSPCSWVESSKTIEIPT